MSGFREKYSSYGEFTGEVKVSIKNTEDFEVLEGFFREELEQAVQILNTFPIHQERKISCIGMTVTDYENTFANKQISEQRLKMLDYRSFM